MEMTKEFKEGLKEMFLGSIERMSADEVFQMVSLAYESYNELDQNSRAEFDKLGNRLESMVLILCAD